MKNCPSQLISFFVAATSLIITISSCANNDAQLKIVYSDNVKWINNFSFSRPYNDLLRLKNGLRGAVISINSSTPSNQILIYGVLKKKEMNILEQEIRKFKTINELKSKVEIKFFRKCVVNDKKEYAGLTTKDLIKTVLIGE